VPVVVRVLGCQVICTAHRNDDEVQLRALGQSHNVAMFMPIWLGELGFKGQRKVTVD
jgi:hypothetical protein